MVTPIFLDGYVPLTLPARDVTRRTGGLPRMVAKARERDTTARKQRASFSCADHGPKVPLSLPNKHYAHAAQECALQGLRSTKHIWESGYNTSIAYFGKKNNPVKHILVLPQARCCGSDRGSRVIVQKPTQGPLLSWRWNAFVLATLCAHGAFGGATRLLFGCRFGGSHRRGHRGIVGFDPCAHAFGRFHIKACLLSHQDKGLGHTSVGRLLQLALQASGGLWCQACQHLAGLRQLVDTLEKVPEGT
jgi:hypothetical protein